VSIHNIVGDLHSYNLFPELKASGQKGAIPKIPPKVRF